MLTANHAIFRKASSFMALSLLVILLPCLSYAYADELTGQAQDDPKDLLPAPPSRPQSSVDSGFLPMPSWARGTTMPPLPIQLKPMGNRTPGAPAPVAMATAPPLAPPKEAPAAAPIMEETSTPRPAPAPAAAQPPTLIAVSPFLQWIKANPQAAAAQARQQANSYHAGQPAPGEAVAPGASAPGEDPYWLPPLIDSSEFGPTAVGGSAAIYETPQR
jgi:hypothetical protein